MSLFRKPTKKYQRRVFGCEDNDEDADPEPPPPPIISKEKKEKTKKSTPLLSFADDEEEVEEFKVKKSTHSKRWTRRKEKDKKKPDNECKVDNNHDEEIESDGQNGATLKGPPKKKTLEGLILSGREALAAEGLGDISDGEEDEESGAGFPRFRPDSVRAALAASGNIPDAALIHAARKTRQKAREQYGNDFIPVPENTSTRPRLIRDDGSGDDDEDDDRIVVRGLELPSDKPTRDAEAMSGEEVDSETEHWEEQQMQKAVPAITEYGMENGMDMNPFAVPPPAPRMDSGPPHLRPLISMLEHTNVSPEMLLVAATQRLSELTLTRTNLLSKKEEVNDRLMIACRTRDSRQSRTTPLDRAYKEAQAARGYITDLVECLDEKMPELDALERRASALHQRHCDYIQERRRADVRDQAQDLLSLAARSGTTRLPDSEEKIRRTAEREGRRRARRLKREATGVTQHRDGDSSDDELPPGEQQQLTAERQAIRREAQALFSDALPAWRSVRGVCRRLSRWRTSNPELYRTAYVPDCLPSLLAPYIRHELILWNPIADEDNEDYERMDWYRCVMMYGMKYEKSGSDSDDVEMNGDESPEPVLSDDALRDDPDLMLVPTLIQKVLLPKLTEIVESSWDPMSVRACVRLRGVLSRVCVLPPRERTQLRALCTTLTTRLTESITNDTFLPALPHQLCEGPGGVFWRRCAGAGVRLLRASLALCSPPLLRPDTQVLALLNSLTFAMGAAPPTLSSDVLIALYTTLPREHDVRVKTMRPLVAFAKKLMKRLETDNPLHLRALEQCRKIMYEAKNLKIKDESD